MPWNEVNLMSQRKEFVEKLLLPGANVSAICRAYDISRKTAYKWLDRYKSGALTETEDRSKSPHHRPNKTEQSIEQYIVSIHKEYPYWGPRKLRNLLINEDSLRNIPAISTFHEILKRNNCQVLNSQRSKPATKRFERNRPNELWQMDFKGSFMTRSHRCYPLTIIDDYSRYSIGLQACRNEQMLTVKDRLIDCFKQFGLPEQINVDNGNPWGSSSLDHYTAFAVWLIKQGVKLTHSAPYHPQTNGKDERFHRTLKLEVLHDREYQSCTDIQCVFDRWQHLYNYKRPHDALNGQPPSVRYNVSSRAFIEKPLATEYDVGEIVRKVSLRSGLFRFKGRRYRGGKGLGGEYIAVKETAKANEFSIFFMDVFIKKFTLESGV